MMLLIEIKLYISRLFSHYVSGQ